MVKIAPQNITLFDFSIRKADNETMEGYSTTIKNMHLQIDKADKNILKLNVAISCQFQHRTHWPIYALVTKPFFGNAIMGAIIERDYILCPSSEIDDRTIYTCIGKSIDKVQETVNALFREEADIPIIPLIPFNDIKDHILLLFIGLNHS